MTDKKEWSWSPSSGNPSTWFPCQPPSKEQALRQYQEFGFRYRSGDEYYIDYEATPKGDTNG